MKKSNLKLKTNPKIEMRPKKKTTTKIEENPKNEMDPKIPDDIKNQHNSENKCKPKKDRVLHPLQAISSSIYGIHPYPSNMKTPFS